MVDYYSKFLIVKCAEGLSVDYQMKSCKIILAEYGKIMSDGGTNFITVVFQEFCRTLQIHHAASSYNQQSNGHIEACIKFAK